MVLAIARPELGMIHNRRSRDQLPSWARLGRARAPVPTRARPRANWRRLP